MLYFDSVNTPNDCWNTQNGNAHCFHPRLELALMGKPGPENQFKLRFGT